MCEFHWQVVKTQQKEPWRNQNDIINITFCRKPGKRARSLAKSRRYLFKAVFIEQVQIGIELTISPVS